MAESYDYKELVKEWVEVVNSHDIDSFDRFVSEDFIEHEESPFVTSTGRDAAKEYFSAAIKAFPDFKMHLEDVGLDGDKLWIRSRMTGTHQNEFMGIPATDRKVDMPVIDVLRVRDGKAVEHWGVSDSLVMMQQLGVVPEGLPA